MMANPRFKWINWNRSCNTAADLVTQARSAKSNANTAESTESGLVLQPPLPRRRSAPYTRDARVRAESWAGARAAAHYARAGARAAAHYASRRLDAGVVVVQGVAA